MQVNTRDLAAGAVFVAIGLFFGLNAWFGLRIGQAYAMGPGYFPVVLGGVLVALGVGIAAAAVGGAREAIGIIPWRGVVLVSAAILFFAVTVRGLGMAPALAGATFFAALSSGRMSWPGAILLALCLTAFCVLLFLFALRLPYPVLGPWLRA